MVLDLLKAVEKVLLTAMGLAILFVGYRLYSVRPFRPSSISFLAAGVFAVIWKGILIVREDETTSVISEVAEGLFAFLTAVGIFFWTASLYDAYAKQLVGAKEKAEKDFKEIEILNKQLRDAKGRTEKELREVERLNKLMVDRELKMIELKEQINRLQEKIKETQGSK